MLTRLRDAIETLLGRLGLSSRLTGPAFASLVVVGIGAAISLALQFVLARSLGKAGYGAYQVALGWLNLAVIVVNFQMDVSATRYVAQYSSTSEWGALLGFVRSSRRFVTRNGLVAAGAAVLVLWIVRDRLDHDVWRMALVASLILPVNAFANLNVCTLQGMHRVIDAQWPTQILRPLVIIAGVLAVVLVSDSTLQPWLALILNAVGVALVAALTTRTIRRYVGSVPHIGALVTRNSEWLRTASGLMIVTVAQFALSQQADVLITGGLLGREAAALYGASSVLASMVTLATSAVGFVSAPAIAGVSSSEDRKTLQRLTTDLVRLNLAVAIPIAVFVAVAGPLMLRGMGAEFVGAYPALLVLLLVQVVSGTVGAQGGFLLTMTGRERQAGWIIGASTLLNLLVTLVLTPTFGIVGTATATLIATVGRVIALELFIRRRLGVFLRPW